jgi:hypothetical protein
LYGCLTQDRQPCLGFGQPRAVDFKNAMGTANEPAGWAAWPAGGVLPAAVKGKYTRLPLASAHFTDSS